MLFLEQRQSRIGALNIGIAANAESQQLEKPPRNPAMTHHACFVSLLFSLAATLAPLRALAQEGAHEEPEPKPPPKPSGHRFALGPRVAYGFPGGKAAASGLDLRESIAGQVAVGLDVGVQLKRGIYFGASGQYGFGLVGRTVADSCDNARNHYPEVDVSCGAHAARFGLQIEYHVGYGKGSMQLDPWVGVGTGLQWVGWDFAVEGPDSAASASLSAAGFEYMTLQLGLDFPIAEWFRMGPFTMATISEFSSATYRCTGDCGEDAGTRSGPITDAQVHAWFFFGVRATFLPLLGPSVEDRNDKNQRPHPYETDPNLTPDPYD